MLAWDFVQFVLLLAVNKLVFDGALEKNFKVVSDCLTVTKDMLFYSQIIYINRFLLEQGCICCPRISFDLRCDF